MPEVSTETKYPKGWTVTEVDGEALCVSEDNEVFRCAFADASAAIKAHIAANKES